VLCEGTQGRYDKGRAEGLYSRPRRAAQGIRMEEKGGLNGLAFSVSSRCSGLYPVRFRVCYGFETLDWRLEWNTYTMSGAQAS